MADLDAIKRDRQAIYGDPRENHRGIAQMIASLLQPWWRRIKAMEPLPEHLIALIMSQVKQNRKRRVFHDDNYDDDAVYNLQFARAWQRTCEPSIYETEDWKPRPKRVYVAGPYTAPTPEGIEANCQRAVNVSAEVMRRGHDAFCPHAATHPLAQIYKADYERWMQFDFGIIFTWADCLLCYQSSPGADREVIYAKALGLPVFYSVDELDDGIRNGLV